MYKVIIIAVILSNLIFAEEVEKKKDNSPWGIGVSAEWSGEYHRYIPLISKAGIKYLRQFPEWAVIQPKKEVWNWKVADKLISTAKANGISILGVWCYFAPWASADGGTRKGPIKDINYWREYVRETVKRYKNDIKYWEVWNEFNGSFYVGKNKPEEYAKLVIAAYEEVKKIDPEIKVGISVANFDVGFFDATIKAGASGHFDFICVHPYENLSVLMKEENVLSFLSLTSSLKKMLSENKQRDNVELWITEIGYGAPVKPDKRDDLVQAEAIVKTYILSIVQGFSKIFWFEVRGPSYGKNTDFGIIRHDWTLRPSYNALKIMIDILGDNPEYIGWYKVDKDGYGFVFRGKYDRKILVAWSPSKSKNVIKFKKLVKVFDIEGNEIIFKKGEKISLTKFPIFILDIPEDIFLTAKNQKDKPYPWGVDYSGVKEIYCRLAAENIEFGLKQVRKETTSVEMVNGEVCRKTRKTVKELNYEGNYVYFRVDPTFVPYGTRRLKIEIVAKRISPDKNAGMNLCYESLKGYKMVENGWRTIPEDNNWHKITWEVDDANFVGGWGWNFRIDAISSHNDFYIKEVRVIKKEKER